jgi:hypothetical protein
VAINDHKTGGGVAKAIRQRIGIEHQVRESRTCGVDLSDNPAAQEVKKKLTPEGPKSKEFTAALSQHRALLERPGSVPVGQVQAISDHMDEIVTSMTPSKPDVPNQAVTTGPTAAKRPTITQDDPKLRDSTGVVRKVTFNAEALIEKAAGEAVGPDGLADPIRTLSRAQSSLLDAFRAEEGRDPGPEDSGYWTAYAKVLMAFTRRVKEAEAE